MTSSPCEQGARAVEKPASSTSVLINPDQWAKILKRLKDKGLSRTLPARVTAQLGLTKGDERLTVLELAVETRGLSARPIYMSPWLGADRLFSFLRFEIRRRNGWVFAADAHLTLLSAATWNTGEHLRRFRSPRRKSVFDNELAYWAVLAELF